MLSDKIVLYPTMAAEHLKCWCDSETEFFIEINVNSPRWKMTTALQWAWLWLSILFSPFHVLSHLNVSTACDPAITHLSILWMRILSGERGPVTCSEWVLTSYETRIHPCASRCLNLRPIPSSLEPPSSNAGPSTLQSHAGRNDKQ